MLVKVRYASGKLYSDTCYKFMCVADVSTTTGEKEASTEPLFIEEIPCDSASYRGFSCAREAVKPKNQALIFPVGPAVYLLQKVDTSIS